MDSLPRISRCSKMRFACIIVTVLCVLVLTVSFWGMTTLLALTSLGKDVMEPLMIRYAVPWMDNEPRAAASEAAEGVSRVLRGEGTGYLEEFFPFLSEKELVHLRDCADLVHYFRLFALSALVISILFFIPGMLFYRKSFFKCAFLASAAYLALLTMLICWGAVHFDSLLLTFHRVFFTNNYWLLDPGRDVLIQFMPVSFFAAYGKIIALRSLLPVSVLACVILCIRFKILSKGLSARK